MLAALSDAKLEPQRKPISPGPAPTGQADATDDESNTTHAKITKIDQYTRSLKFDADNSFRVVQFSDIWNDGDSQNFLETQKLVENILKKEQPDLVIISGNTVST